MVAGRLTVLPFIAFDENGVIPGAKVYTYETGTSTPKTTYSDKELTTPNSNPVVCDAAGQAFIYFSGTMKVVIKDADDVTVVTIDNVDGVRGVEAAIEYYNIVIAAGQTYETFAAYLADSPVAGDRVLIRVDETITATYTIPSGIELCQQKGNKFTVSTSVTPVFSFGDNVSTIGDFRLEADHTTTITTAFELNGSDNNHQNLIIDNTSSGTITNGIVINASKRANYARADAIKSGAGNITNPLVDNSTTQSNDVVVRDEGNGITLRTEIDTATIDTLTTTDVTISNDVDIAGVQTVDTINEHTTDAGLTIDGLLIKDGIIQTADSVAKTIIKTATGAVSGGAAVASIVMQDYCFFPNIYSAASYHALKGDGTDTSDTVGRLYLHSSIGTPNYDVEYRYITSSDRPFIYAIQDKDTGVIENIWMCEDPPPDYWGMSEPPEGFVPPLIVTDENGQPTGDNKNEIIIFDYDIKEYKEIFARIKKEKTRDNLPHHILSEKFDYDKKKKLFKLKNLAMI